MAVKKKKLKSLSGRVIKVRDKQHFQKLTNDSRLCVVVYTAAWKEGSQHLRKALKDVSSARQYGHVLFAELETEATATQDIVQEQQIEGTKVQAWRRGELLEVKPGSAPYILHILRDHAGEPPRSDSKWRGLGKKVLIAAAVAAAGLAAAVAVQRFVGSLADDEIEGNLTREEAELLDIDERIQEIEEELQEERDIEARQKALERQEQDEGIMRMPAMPGTETPEKDRRNPGSAWFLAQEKELRDLRQREQELSEKIEEKGWS